MRYQSPSYPFICPEATDTLCDIKAPLIPLSSLRPSYPLGSFITLLLPAHTFSSTAVCTPPPAGTGRVMRLATPPAFTT